MTAGVRDKLASGSGYIHGILCRLKKNQNASRPSEHPPVRGKNVKTFRWDHRLQRQNLFMTFNRDPQRGSSIVVVSHMCVCVVCVFFPFILDIKFVGRTGRGHTGGRSHRRKVTQDFSSTFFLRCAPTFFSREGFSHSFPSSTVKSNSVY